MSSARPITAHEPLNAASCRVRFGAPAAAINQADGEPILEVALPVLDGAASEILLPQECQITGDHDCAVFSTREQKAGFALAVAGKSLEAAAHDVYRRIFAAIQGQRLCRMWNYVPNINTSSDGLENYRRFCRGRSLAFEEAFGRGFERELPSASAVGAMAGPLAVAFLATTIAPRHFENPHQVPAFAYPADYGPRAPSFSRATLIRRGGQEQLFISGTAAIRGHHTIAPDEIAGQLPCTVENLQIIAETSGAGPGIGAKEGWQRAFKVYVRHSADLETVKEYLEEHMLASNDDVTYLQADLCRTDLRVEIEAVLARNQSPVPPANEQPSRIRTK